MRHDDPTLRKLFGQATDRFVIPPYQRRYAWSEEQCEALLADAVRTARAYKDDSDAMHFFGSIIVSSEGSDGDLDLLSVVDGQQRLTTVMILAAAIRDIDPEAATSVQSWLAEGGEMVSPEKRVRLSQVKADRGPFERLMLGLPPEPGDESSTALCNYSYLKKRLQDPILMDGLTGRDVFWGLTRFRVIRIDLDRRDGGDGPQEVFEAMNSLSQPLTFADLVRNRLLMNAPLGSQSELYEDLWLPLEETLGGPGTDRLSSFVRDWLQMRLSKPLSEANTERQKRDLYLEFKNHIAHLGDGAEAAVLKDLKECSKSYLAMIDPSVSCGNPTLDVVVGDLERVQSKPTRPIVLWCLTEVAAGRVEAQKALSILTALRTYVLRRRILVGKTQGENKGMPHWVAKLPAIASEKDPWAAMMALLQAQGRALRLPTDEEVSQQLLSMEFYRNASWNSTALVILALVEEALTKSHPNLEAGDLQLEHIMPRNLTPAWRDELGEGLSEEESETLHDTLVHGVGNITLTRHNPELSDAPFAKKKAIYETNGGMQVARDHIVDCEHWDAAAIHRRADWLCDVFLRQVAPIPVPNEGGAYSLSPSLNLSGRKPASFSFKGQESPCKSWNDMLRQVARALWTLDSDALSRAVVSGAAGGHFALSETPHCDKVADGFWVKTNTSTPEKMVTLSSLFDAVDMDYRELTFTLRPERDMSVPPPVPPTSG